MSGLRRKLPDEAKILVIGWGSQIALTVLGYAIFGSTEPSSSFVALIVLEVALFTFCVILATQSRNQALIASIKADQADLASSIAAANARIDASLSADRAEGTFTWSKE